MSFDLLERARFVVQLFQECDAIQLPHGPTERVLRGMIDRIEELEAKLRKSALQELSALGQASEAYQAQLAAEAKLAQQDDLVQAAVAAALREAAQVARASFDGELGYDEILDLIPEGAQPDRIAELKGEKS